MLKLFIFSLFMFLWVTVNANVIKGRVLDSSNKNSPLVGVNIFWSGTTKGTISNKDGFFEIHKHPSNSVLIFSYIGYQTDSINTFEKKEVTIYLTEGAELNEVTVTERTKSSATSKINPILTQNISSKELSKFACCNLSESFETNASVDVSYSDAVSGIKQIKMLGLSGRYSQLMLENIPIIRGAETAFGLDYIPGTWMESIQVSKGTSAVKNGYEGMTGQINVRYQNPDNNEKSHLYFYGNQDGKLESNAGISFKTNESWSSNILIHLSSNTRKLDMNDDGFLDKPLTYTGSIMNRWNYFGDKVEAKIGFSYLEESRKGGQKSFNHSKTQDEQTYYGIGIDIQ